MLQLHISKSLTPDLKSHMCDYSDNPGAMQWYAHRVHVLRRKCVIVMERESRYAILFNGLTRPDFARFPELLRGRLFREVLSICHLQNDQAARLAALVDMVTDPVEVMPGNDRSVQSHINQVVFEFDWMAQEIGALPESKIRNSTSDCVSIKHHANAKVTEIISFLWRYFRASGQGCWSIWR